MKSRFLIFLFFFTPIFVFSQKNSFSIEYTRGISKIFFEHSLDDYYDQNSGLFRSLYKTSGKKKSISFNTFTFAYRRSLNKNLRIGLFARNLTRGLRINYSYSLVDANNLPDDFGGVNFIYRLKSNEVGLLFEHTLLEKESINFFAGLKIALDVFDQLEVRENYIDKFTGVSAPSGNVRGHFTSGKEGFFNRYFDSISNDLFRFSSYLNFGSEVKTIIKNLSFLASIDIGGSSKMQTSDERITSNLPDGWIFLGSAQAAVLYKF